MFGTWPSVPGVFSKAVLRSLRGVSGQPGVSWSLGAVRSLLGVFLGNPCPGVFLESRGHPESPWSLREFTESPGVSGGRTPESPWSLRATPDSPWSLRAFPESPWSLSWSGQVIGRELCCPLCARRDGARRHTARAGHRAGALPTSTKFPESQTWCPANGPVLSNSQNSDSDSAGDSGM